MRGRRLLALPAALLLAVVFVWPVGFVLLRGVSDPHWGVQNFLLLAERPVYLRVIGNTIVVSASVTAICALIGYPYAHAMANGPSWLRRALVFVAVLPFWTSILVRSFAWMVLLQRRGLVNRALLALGLADRPLDMMYNRTGTLVGMVQILLPFMIFPLYAVMRRIDPAYAGAASVLGAGPVRAFLRVYLPLSMPGLATGCTLVFIVALGYFIVPALLGGPRDVMVAQLIQQQISDLGNWGMAGALSAALLGATVLILALARRLFGVRDIWTPT